jgi:hypothetical protein
MLNRSSWNRAFVGPFHEHLTREKVMKALIALAAAVVATAAASPADARQGCGPGFHRAPNGMCRPNRATRIRYVEGRFYPGQGYWWHNRWRHHRQRRNGVWIYL